MDVLKITSPIDIETIDKLRAGTQVLISGTVYTARDAAHKRLAEAFETGEKLPFDPEGQTIYYIGPSPAKPGQVIGSAGPTTAARMDSFTPQMLKAGIKATIGKGTRSAEIKKALQKYKAVYLAATGGASALLSKSIKEAEIVAYEDLGPEAILKLQIEDLPAIVAYDSHGGDLFEQEITLYQRSD